MLHEVLAAYLDRVERAILQYHVIASDKPNIEQVVREAVEASG